MGAVRAADEKLQGMIVCTGGTPILLRLYLGVLWLLGVGSCVLGAVRMIKGEPNFWFLIGMGSFMFIPIAALVTLIERALANQRILVNPNDGRIRFESVYPLSGFLPRQVSFECMVSELAGVYFSRGNGSELMYIVTPNGRVVLHSWSKNYYEIRDFLLTEAPTGRPPLSSRSWFLAAVGLVVVMALLAVGFATGWLP